MNRSQELDLHEKLYHSRYLSKECPKCMMRFLEDKQLKHHLQYTCSRFCPKIESSSTSGSSSLSRKTRRSLSEYQNQNSWFYFYLYNWNKPMNTNTSSAIIISRHGRNMQAIWKADVREMKWRFHHRSLNHHMDSTLLLDLWLFSVFSSIAKKLKYYFDFL